MEINIKSGKFSFGILFVLLLFLLTACSYLQKREFEQKRQQWSAQKIANYRYTIKMGAFSQDAGKSVRIEVREAKQVSLKCIECELKKPEIFTKLDTIEKLFDEIQKEAEDDKHNLEVKYEENLGYPIYWKGQSKDVKVMDDWWRYEISDFEIIK